MFFRISKKNEKEKRGVTKRAKSKQNRKQRTNI
jgi:hypothetical protein